MEKNFTNYFKSGKSLHSIASHYQRISSENEMMVLLIYTHHCIHLIKDADKMGKEVFSCCPQVLFLPQQNVMFRIR